MGLYGFINQESHHVEGGLTLQGFVNQWQTTRHVAMERHIPWNYSSAVFDNYLILFAINVVLHEEARLIGRIGFCCKASVINHRYLWWVWVHDILQQQKLGIWEADLHNWIFPVKWFRFRCSTSPTIIRNPCCSQLNIMLMADDGRMSGWMDGYVVL